ncbi:MAG TPA: hypothetical protein VJQ79_08445 [Acidimicrobiia bacterium]|nr:hypothetical protein [Acidimicrobiia bacterium]
MNEPNVEAALRDLAEGIDWPSPVDFTLRLQDEGPLRKASRPRLAWAVAVLALVLVVLSVPSARQAVANLLDVAGIRIEFGNPPSLPPPRELAPGQLVDQAAADAAVDFPILKPDVLEPPGSVYLLRADVGTQVFLAWAASDQLPEVGGSGIGLLLAEFRADLDEEFFTKIVSGGTTVDRVMVDGVPAFWLSGAPHVFMFQTGPREHTEDGTRLTGNVLIWEADGITYRLESNLSLDESLRIAGSLAP